MAGTQEQDDVVGRCAPPVEPYLLRSRPDRARDMAAAWSRASGLYHGVDD